MDGIAGIVFPDVFQATDLITPMLNTMAHRGHSIQDRCAIKSVQLGSCGHKIKTNRKKTVFCGLDGTIYNHFVLQAELRQLGHEITSDDPAETIAHAFEEWNDTFFDRLSGDFAIMIYDQKNESLYLVRDRIGKKPLYWYQDQHHFIFASELKAILASGAVPQTLANDATAAYFYFGYIPQDMTPIKNVSKLLPSHYLEIHKNFSKSIQPYWSYSAHFESKKEDPSLIITNLDKYLTQSVNKRMPQPQKIGNLPFGCFLSGGLGSASIAHYLKKCAPEHPLVALSVGFKGQNEEDIFAAQEVAKSLNIPQQKELLTPANMFDSLVKIIWHLDEPLADPNIVATWNLCQLAGEQTNTVFSGMGSDELLAGHERYTSKETKLTLLQRMMQASPPLLHALLLPLLKLLYKPGAYELLKQQKGQTSQFEYITHNALFDEKQLAEASPKLSGYFDPELFLNKFQNIFQLNSNVSSYLYFDVKTRLADCYLLQFERLTAAHSLNWHTPYLDRTVIEYLASLYEPELLTESETATYLKKILKNVFSEKFINRPKTVRRNFLEPWLYDPQVREIANLLPKGILVENGIISEQWIREGLAGTRKCHEPFRCMWSILVLEIWYRLFINEPITPIPPNITVLDLLS